MARVFVQFLTLSGSLAFVAASLHAAPGDPAATYPDKPIRFIVPFSPEQFNAHIKSEIAKWTKLVKEANLRFDK